jgi:hypothetical protein
MRRDATFYSCHGFVSLGVGQHAGDATGVFFPHDVGGAKATLTLGRLLGQDVALEGMAGLEFAGRRLAEPLGSGPVGLIWAAFAPLFKFILAQTTGCPVLSILLESASPTRTGRVPASPLRSSFHLPERNPAGILPRTSKCPTSSWRDHHAIWRPLSAKLSITVLPHRPGCA